MICEGSKKNKKKKKKRCEVPNGYKTQTKWFINITLASWCIVLLFILYTYVAPNHKIVFFFKGVSRALTPICKSPSLRLPYMLLLLYIIRLSLHFLKCETKCRGTSEGAHRPICMNKFMSMCIILYYNAPLFTIFEFVVFMASTCSHF